MSEAPPAIIGLQLVASAVILERAARDLILEAAQAETEWEANHIRQDADRVFDRAIELRRAAKNPEAAIPWRDVR